MNTTRIVTAYIAAVLIDEAKKEFGVTTDFSKGAWLLPDGSLLDFKDGSGRQDHSKIQKIFPKELLEQEPEHYISEKDFVKKKFLEAGAIRLVAEGGGIEISKAPTPQQMEKIDGFIRWLQRTEFFLDLSGHGKDFRQMYDNKDDDIERAMRTIGSYFRGELQNVNETLLKYHYSDDSKRHLIQ